MEPQLMYRAYDNILTFCYDCLVFNQALYIRWRCVNSIPRRQLGVYEMTALSLDMRICEFL